MALPAARPADAPGATPDRATISRRALDTPLSFLALAAGGVLVAFPFLWMAATALKGPREIFELHFWPQAPTLDNFRQVLTATQFPRWFFNSFVIAAMTTVSAVFFDSLTGYTLAKMRFRGRNIIFIAILSTLMIPTEMLIIPWYTMSVRLGWIDTYWGSCSPGSSARSACS